MSSTAAYMRTYTKPTKEIWFVTYRDALVERHADRVLVVRPGHDNAHST